MIYANVYLAVNKPNRIIENVVGYESARIAVSSWAKHFNECNPENNAVVSASGLDAWDENGSGEFCKAICTNLKRAKSTKSERYKIVVPW